MRIAKFWHRAEASTPDTQYTDHSWTRWAWGWSDDSPEAAAAMAQQRADAVVERVARADLAGGDWKDWYDYDERPLPELVVQTVENPEGTIAGALTINRYGATILNTARLAIVDVDLPERLLRPPSLFTRMARRLFGTRDPHANGGEGAGGATPLQQAIEQRVSFVRSWVQAGHAQGQAHAQEQQPGRGARVYRTAGGLRVILVSPPMDPAAPETDHLMTLMDADPLYRRLCKGQGCYRARLTPKPWRLGLVPGEGQHTLTFATLTSDDPATKARVQAWLDAYERRSAGHAVCRLLECMGEAEPTDPTTATLIEMHDSATLGAPDAPLA